MSFAEEIDRVLPPDIPHRSRLVEKSGQHLEMIAAANEYMNLTRISNPAEAAVKHVYDSLAPWRHFASASAVLDVGTGAGFPGIPLAIMLPEIRFVLSESVGKKARFVDSVVEALDLRNVDVVHDRGETLALTRRSALITARAVAPLERLLDLFRKAILQGSRLLLFKGPDVESEMAEAAERRIVTEVVCRYELPDGLGTRTLVSAGIKRPS